MSNAYAAITSLAAGGLGVWALALVAAGLATTTLAYRRRWKSSLAETERRRAELRRAHEISAVCPDQFYCWDIAGGTEQASPGLASTIGLPRGRQPTFEDVLARFGNEDAVRLGGHVEELRATGKGFAFAARTAEGGHVLRMTGLASGFAAGKPAAAVLWLSDDTSRARAEIGLDEEIGGLRRLLDSLPVAVWRRGPDLRLDYVNLAYRAAVEAAPDAAPETGRELAAGFDQDHGRTLARRALETGERQHLAQHVVIDGARRLFEVNEAPLDEGGRIAGYAFDQTDIEEVRAQLNRHIAGHEELLHRLGTAVAIYGADQRIKFFNHAFVHLWRIEEHWLRSGPKMGEILEALRENRRLPEAANFPEFKATQLAFFTSLLDSREELTHLPDGTTLRAAVTPHPFGGLLLTWEDVTDTLALERSFNTLLAVQRETLDNLHEGVAVIGADGRLQLSNPAFGQIWQLDDRLLAARPHVSEIVERMRGLIDDGTDWPTLKGEVIALLTDRAGHTDRIERSDGSILEFASVPLPDGAVLLGYLDVSDSIRVERALRERNEALETADRLKTEFIAHVSYELRTPLNTIIGFSELLAGRYFGDLNERQTEYGNGILESSRRLMSLINDILDLAMIESGRLVLELDHTDIHRMLSAVLELTREPMLEKSLTLVFDCPEDIGSILADERRLKQALFSILSNAVKFTPDNGTITVAARRYADRIMLDVTDTGIGVSEADRTRVFNRFERGDAPEARRLGAGLCLSLVKSFIELHDGQVTLDSQPGAGTRVTCVLPIREEAALSGDRLKANAG